MVAVLEGQPHSEVALQAPANRVGGQSAQELPALGFARRWYGVVGELAGRAQRPATSEMTVQA
jgi:hypothetical protein